MYMSVRAVRRVALVYEATDAVNLHATAGRGAKSGGFPRLTLSAALGAPSRAYAESTSWTYGAGVKSSLFGGRGHLVGVSLSATF